MGYFFARKSKRVKLNKMLKFGKTDTLFSGNLYDISRSGLRIISSKAYIPGTDLNMKLFVDNKVLNMKGRVIWVSNEEKSLNSWMGVELLSNTSEFGKLYKKIILHDKPVQELIPI